MKVRKITVNKLQMGDILEEDVFLLVEIIHKKNAYYCILQDSTGSIKATIGTIPQELVDSDESVAVAVSGIVYMEQGEKILKLRKMERSEQVNGISLIKGISKETAQKYLKDIQNLMSMLSGDYRKLVIQLLDKEMLCKLAVVPASLEYGNYRGGALTQTVEVSYMCLALAEQYEKKSSGLCSQKVNKELLIASCLLHMIGTTQMYTPYPSKKTRKGLLTTLTDITIRLIQNVDIDEEIADMVIHCIQSIEYNGIAEVCKEAVLLRTVSSAYKHMLGMDEFCKEAERESDGIVYNKKSHRYVLVSRRRDYDE